MSIINKAFEGDSILQVLEKAKEYFIEICKSDYEFTDEKANSYFEREKSFVLSFFQGNKEFQGNVHKITVFTSFVGIAANNVSLDPVLDQASVYQSFGNALKLDVKPRGYLNSLVSKGIFKKYETRVIYENDDFKIKRIDGENEIVEYSPVFKEKGNPLLCYVSITFPDGSKKLEWLDFDDFVKFKEKSKSKNTYEPKDAGFVSMFISKTIKHKVVKFLDKRANAKVVNLENGEEIAISTTVGADDDEMTNNEMSHNENLEKGVIAEEEDFKNDFQENLPDFSEEDEKNVDEETGEIPPPEGTLPFK